ncbi:unnamed protein product [Rhizophagus irregularis]|nr:unnamed protein product [Rhizophagus irregularis]
MPKIKAKKTCENIPKEITEYPKTDVILYTDGRRSYYYRVKKEGLYLQPPILAYSQGKNKYKIPDSYCGYVWVKIFRRCFSNTSPTAAANAVIRLKEQVQIEGAKIYGKNQVILKQISYNVKHMGFQIAYGSKDDREKEKKLTSIVQVIDQNYMSREGYKALAAVKPNLEREWIVSEQ